MQELSRESEPVAERPLVSAAVPTADLGFGIDQGLQTIDSEQLFRGGRVLHIQHEGALYQLRLTKLGKLILTK
jgi:hemin uptake protein HemP